MTHERTMTQQDKKMKRAQEEYRKIVEELKPFLKPKKERAAPSTSGRWSTEDAYFLLDK